MIYSSRWWFMIDGPRTLMIYNLRGWLMINRLRSLVSITRFLMAAPVSIAMTVSRSVFIAITISVTVFRRMVVYYVNFLHILRFVIICWLALLRFRWRVRLRLCTLWL